MKTLSNSLEDQRGQMAILVMLVLVISLTIGLAVMSRTLTNIRLTTNTDLSNKAYSAAEAGIEEYLRDNSTTTGSNINVGTSGNVSYKITTAGTGSYGGNSNPFAFPNPLDKDEASQIWLFDYNYYKNNNGGFPTTNQTPRAYYNETSNQISLYWGSGSSAPSGDRIPALEAAFIYRDTASSTFGIEKYALDYYSSVRGNNFETPEYGPYTLSNTSQGSKTYYYRKTVTLSPSSSRLYLLLRLKLLYNYDSSTSKSIPHEVAVAPGSGGVMPVQGQIIESEGRASDVVRKVKVYQSYPTLPGIFDFVLFNGSTNPLQK